MALSRSVARLAALLVALLGMTVSLALGLLSAFETAKATPRTGLLMAVAVLIFFAGSWLTCTTVARLWRGTHPKMPLAVSLVCSALFAVAILGLVLRPGQYAHPVPPARANTQYWILPSGSHIAYSVYIPPAGMPVKPDPIVFLHGGPGYRATDHDHAFYSQFANDGFKVYLFDQAGSGLRIDCPRGPTTPSNVLLATSRKSVSRLVPAA